MSPAKSLILLAFASVAGYAADSQNLSTVPVSGAVALFRMIGSLAVVMALFFAGAWLFRNMHRFRRQNAPQRKLHVLEARHLGARQAIYVVGFEGERLLIGSSSQGLTLLTRLANCAPLPEAEQIVPVSFGEALLQALGRK